MLPGKSLKPQDILRMVKRRIWLITLPPIFTLFAALLYSSTLPNLYQSDMLIAIEPQRVPDSFVRSTVTLPTDRRVDAITVQVLSRTTLQNLIESLNLYQEERKVMPLEDVIARMRSNIQTPLERPRPLWGVPPTPTAFHVQFTYGEPTVAAQVTQQLGSLFVQQNVKERTAQAGATNRFLETQLAEARAGLEAQEQRLEAYRQQFGKELPTQMQANLQSLQTSQLRAQSLNESIARDRDRKQLLDRLYRDALNEPPPPVPVNAPANAAAPVAAAPAQQLATGRAALASLESRYRPDHPDVVRARRQVADLEAKVASEAPAAGAAPAAPDAAAVIASQPDPARRENLRQMIAEMESLDRQIAFKEAEERRVRSEVTEYQRRLEAVPGHESDWVKLTRDYDTMQTAYRDLLVKSTAAQAAADLETQDIGERFRIVDPATVPVRPLRSMRVQYNLGGLLLGLLLGLGTAVVLEVRDRSYRSDEDVLEVLNLPVLASVPRILTSADRKRQFRRRLAFSLGGAACFAVAGYFTWSMRLWNNLI